MLATSIYLIVFRVLHVLFAIAWGGAVFLMVFFLQPTAKAIGPAAGPFMRELLGTRTAARLGPADRGDDDRGRRVPLLARSPAVR